MTPRTRRSGRDGDSAGTKTAAGDLIPPEAPAAHPTAYHATRLPDGSRGCSGCDATFTTAAQFYNHRN